MLNQFSRTELLIGKNGLEKLRKSRIAIFGVGGVGGYAFEALVRAGIGEIDLIDNDKVSLTNLNRQVIATHDSIDKYKVDVAKERAESINPDIKINKFITFYTPKDIIDFSRYDYVIDAIDTVASKLSIIEEAKKAGVPIISAMGAGNKMDAKKFEIADISETSVCPLARVIRQELKKRKILKVKVAYSKEPPIKPEITTEKTVKHQVPGSNSYAPAIMGFMIAGEVVNDILKL